MANIKTNNQQYAPGISTYGLPGNPGALGPQGASVFYTTYDLSDSDDLKKCNLKIRENKLLTDNSDKVIARKYIIGDIIVDCTASMYKVQDVGSAIEVKSEECLGQFSWTDANSYFSYAGTSKRIYNKLGDGIDIIRTNYSKNNDVSLYALTGLGTSDYIERIYTDIPNQADTLRYDLLSNMVLTNGDTHSLDIWYDKGLDNFHISSDSKIVIDCSAFYINDTDTSSESSDEYSKVSVTSNNLSLLYNIFSGATYSKTGNNITINLSSDAAAMLAESNDYLPYNMFIYTMADDGVTSIKSIQFSFHDPTKDYSTAALITAAFAGISTGVESTQIRAVSLVNRSEIFLNIQNS